MPPTRVNTHTGALMAKESSPTKTEEAPRFNNSHGWATCWVQVPIFESRLANQNVPNRRVRKRRMDSRKAVSGIGLFEGMSSERLSSAISNGPLAGDGSGNVP